MTVMGYLLENWDLLVLLIGMAIALSLDIHLERDMIRRIAITNGLLFVYSITNYIETYLGNQTEYTIARPILTASNYTLVTFILLCVILVMYPMQKGYLFIPAILNAVLCFISVPTKLVFFISPDNHFGRGRLGYLVYFVNSLYMLYLIYCVFRNSRSEKEERKLLVFMLSASVMCLVLPLFINSDSPHWFIMTIAVDVMLYYVFLLQQFTRRDTLTRLLNRQSYYADADKYFDEISAVITMDMDGLKEINDNEGHIAGDEALKALAECFWNTAHKEHRIYRIGGDEFVIMCLESDESKVRSLVERIRKELEKLPYSCSIGFAMKGEDSTIDSLYNEADEMLYEEKRKFYILSGKLRRRH